ncbi:MAG TPA: Na(+)-translocating NADH-quinone reductase subunit C [Aquaticitalea sp.]|nr:Na(+)-translocating NADH-quinone reductase subunit C [Aquaticitalea sp.]
MSNKTDSNVYTVIFAIIMVVVVGAMLAFASSTLSGKINENKRLEKQQNILYSMGINENEGTSVRFISSDKVSNAFSKYVTKQIVIQNGKVTSDDQAYLIDIKAEKSKPNNERRLPLFIGENNGKTMYVVPVYGKGLWNDIWGYVAINQDLILEGVFFDHLGETPGLGANIKERYFMDDFIGEHLMDKDGNYAGVNVVKNNADPKNEDKTDNEVDALAGATITGNGVAEMIINDLRLYVDYIKSLKE